MTSNSPTLAPYYVSSGPKHVSLTKEFTSSHFQAFPTRHFAMCQLFIIISPWSPHLLLRRFSVFRQTNVQVSPHSLLIISLALPSDLLLALAWIRPTTPHIVSGVPEHLIKLHGDWRSDAYQVYLSLPLSTRAQVADIMAAGPFTNA